MIIYISKMPNFDVFSHLECKKHKVRSHDKQKKNGNIKQINFLQKNA